MSAANEDAKPADAKSDPRLTAKADDFKPATNPNHERSDDPYSRALREAIAMGPTPGGGPTPGVGPHAARDRAETVGMPAELVLGPPPELPLTVAPPRPLSGGVENPTHMPDPRKVPGGQPTDPAAAPGHVPTGDSRSLRRGDYFALVYRRGTFVISRFGVIGTRGQWRVVEYPTSSAAAHAYAKECSRFATEGFSDYRD
jgi:hypothetical protein